MDSEEEFEGIEVARNQGRRNEDREPRSANAMPVSDRADRMRNLIPGQRGVPPQVLNPLYDFLEGIRDEILVKNREQIECANEMLFNDMKEVTVQLVAQVLAQVISRPGNIRGPKRAAPKWTTSIPAMEKLVDDRKRFIAPLLRSLIMVTVACFATKHSELRGWLTDHVYRSLADYATVLPFVSGFSTIWFSKVSSDTKERFRTDIGGVWSCVIRAAMVSTVMAMWQEYKSTSSPDPDRGSTPPSGAAYSIIPGLEAVPSWLRELADCTDGGRSPGANLIAMVNKVVGEEESTRGSYTSSICDGESDLSGSASRPRRKRPKTTAGVEDQKLARETVLKRLYASMRSYLGEKRTPCRLVLFSDLLFLTQKINSSFENESAASAGGYRIKLRKPASEAEEGPVADAIRKGAIWNIKNARVSGDSERDRIEFNDGAFREIQSAFPSLYLSLQYRRKVIVSPRDKVDEFAEEHCTPDLHWDYREEVSLHDTAKKLLMEIVRMKDADSLLQISSFSLKAIHIIALALRGLVKQQLKRQLSEVEESALGGCISTKLAKDSQFVSPLLGMVGSELGKEFKSKQEHEWEKKFSMTWTAFKTAKREWRRQQSIQGQTSAHSLSVSSDAPLSERDAPGAPFVAFDDKWMYCADEEGETGES